MSRLPVPGQDADIWGDVLNDFLAVAHQPDGSLKPSAIPPASVADATSGTKGVVQLAGDLGGTAASPTVPGLAGKYSKPAGGIPETDLDSNVQTKLNSGGSVGDATSSTKGILQLAGDLGGTAASPTVPGLANKVDTSAVGALNGVASLDGSGKVPTGQLPATADATTTSKGIVQLAGDLGGTASSPTVPGLASKINTSEKGALNGVATLDGSGKVPSAQLPAASAPADATTSSKGILQLAGDLGGTAASPTVPGLANKINSSEKGAINGVATLDGSGKVTSSQLPVSADATTTSKGIVQLAGDLGGTAASPTVPNLANKVDKTTTISAGSGLTGGGDLSANRTLSVSFGSTTGTVAAGDDSRITGAEQKSNKGVANGYAGLDATGHIPATQLNIGSRIQPFSSSGNLMIETGTHRLYNDTSVAWTILSVRANVGTPSTGASVITDIKVNGTTIFTTQANRPTIAASAYTSGKVTNMDVTTVPAGNYLTVDVAQVGSTFPGADLTVQIEVQ